KYLATCCVVLIACTATAQYEVSQFRHYTTREGLSNNYITGIIQDSSGYIWISTERGLNRFDGYNFKPFLQTSEHKSIPDNTIISERLLLGNQIAISTSDGAGLITTANLHTTVL